MSEFTPPNRICKLEVTTDTLSGRGGIALFCRYLEKVGIYALLLELFAMQRKSKKGLAIWKLFKQVMCFFFDGTSRHLTYFDQLAKDEGYQAVIEEEPKQMASSHAIKRFFKSFGWMKNELFRKLLRRLFVWRLTVEQPDVIELTLDTMVMDNDEAEQRQGVKPTYKKVKGFQPLQLIWNGMIIDALFRSGSKHSNSGTAAVQMVKTIVNYIRSYYRPDVTIVLRVDAGFYDNVNFEAFNRLNIVFIASGKMYQGVKEVVKGSDPGFWGTYDNGRQQWTFIEFGYRGDSFTRFWRAFYTHAVYEDGQKLLEFARPDNVILTNAGINPLALEHLDAEQRQQWLEPHTLIASHHARGADELPHRGLKDFGFEQLPFKRFAPNSAFYYCMLVSFFLFESFKRDVLSEVISEGSYATTVRRIAVDFAVKVVRTAGQICLKVPQGIAQRLRLDVLWKRCQHPTPILS